MEKNGHKGAAAGGTERGRSRGDALPHATCPPAPALPPPRASSAAPGAARGAPPQLRQLASMPLNRSEKPLTPSSESSSAPLSFLPTDSG
jgi:hypothetical protein